MSDEIITMSRDEFEELKGQLAFLDFELTRLLSQPLVHATVVQASNEFLLDAFENGDRMLVIDKELRKQKKFYGKIASQGVDEQGWVIVEYLNGGRDRLNIGLNGELPQVKLVGKNDGTNAVITVDGKLFEVHGLPGKTLNSGDNVKVDMESKQIHDIVGVTSAGDVVHVKDIVDELHVEVETNGHNRVVIHPTEMKLEAGDRVMLDNSNTMAVRVLAKEDSGRYNLLEQSNTTWDQIAGLEDVKENLQEALELPYLHPEVYKFYNKKPPKGILLYGPPGCGKTLTAKAAANSLAKTHGAESYQSGFIYVKGPELLSKWVGIAEQEVRSLFTRGREHYKRHGYPALLFIDEAEALLRMRGSGRSSDIESTVVPMFLSEMDGLQESHLIVMLATNQQKLLDPAVIREGRVDRHIRVSRPNLRNTVDYLKIHMTGIPLAKGVDVEELQGEITAELFSQKRVIFKVTHKSASDLFRLSDSLSGSMLAGLVDQATSRAMRRDLKAGKKKSATMGVTVNDFKDAIEEMYRAHSNLNLTFDLEDFCDSRGFSRNETKVEKIAA